MRNWLLAGAIALSCCGSMGLELPTSRDAVAQTVDARKAEADKLLQQGIQQFQISQFEAALQSWQQALKLYRELKDRLREGAALGNLGLAYRALGSYPKAIDYYEQSLVIAREIKDRRGEGKFLGGLGSAYYSLGNYPKAINYYEQSLEIAREIKDRLDEGNALGNLGLAYDSLGNYPKAIDFHEQSLVIARELKNRLGEGGILGNLGLAYYSLGNYPKAINYHEQRLAIAREIKDRNGEGKALGNLGLAYYSLGNYLKAINYHEQRLAIAQEIKDRRGEGIVLGNLGNVYQSLGNYSKAINYHKQRLVIAREIKDRRGEGNALGNLGSVYYSLGNHPKAVDYYEQSLAIAREIKNRDGEGNALGNLGNAYDSLGNYPKAIDYLEQSLTIAQEIKDRDGERLALNNLGATLNKQNKSDLAIIFYKQSVNVSESIRKDNQSLSRDLQTSYTETVAGTYRNLADLLIQQGRIGEAQQVLELLKLQEIKTYTRSSTPQEEIALNRSEQEILKTYNSLITFGQELRTCKANPTCQTSDKLAQLIAQRDQQNLAFETLLKTLKTQLKERQEKDIAWIDPNDPKHDLRRRADDLLTAQPGSLLIYPLVLDDKMWLLVASEGPVLTRYQVNVSQTQLAQTIIAFRDEMKRCETRPCTKADHDRAKALSQKLYTWMFPPELQTAIKNAKTPITNLIFAPDRATRYIPMEALHDGQKYLTERFTLSTIVAASKTETNARLPKTPTVIGLGLSEAVPGFSPLPSVIPEIQAIVKTTPTELGIFPGNRFLDRQFTQTILKTRLSGHDILHLATHGKFVPGSIDRSFLVLGDGSHLPIETINTIDELNNVHLVVLSACETALGDRREEDGIEIAGISNIFLQRGAKAVIASLWQVNDPATALYMQRFYHYLSQPNTTKAKAMQSVRQEFLDGKIQLKDLDHFRAGGRAPGTNSGPIDLTHPYYWAPFILIGNSL